MAMDLHNGEGLLRCSHFLADQKGPAHKQSNFDSVSGSPSSLLSELALSETETQTENDDYIAQLARQMVHFMLQDDDQDQLDKLLGFSGRPKENLRSPLGSNSRSPDTFSMPVIEKEQTCSDNFAGKSETVNTNNEDSKYPKLGQFQTFSTQPTSIPISPDNPSFNFRTNQTLYNDQIKDIQINNLKQQQQQQQVFKQKRVQEFQKKEKARSGYVNGIGGVGSFGNSYSPSMPSVIQQVSGPGMKAFFLDGSGKKGGGGSPSAGTGVFLPCAVGNRTASQLPRKKRGCSPVLIPAKVLQALKVHFDRMGHSTTGAPNFTPTFPLQYDVSVGDRHGTYSQKKRHVRTKPAMKHNGIGLPQDWTY